MNSAATRWLDRTLYPGIGDNWDDEFFRQKILARIRPGDTVLDLGAGAGLVKQMNFKGLARRICGVDLDARVTDNPMLDEGRVSDAGAIPYEPATFDLVFADNVLEHLAEPAAVFREVARVLKPGGLFLFKTPNKYHYVPIIARFTPHWFHEAVNRRRGRKADDVFPTLYRANTRRDVLALAAITGFDPISIETVERRPEYLRISLPTYLAGAAYERLVNASGLFAPLRVVLIGALQKPGR